MSWEKKKNKWDGEKKETRKKKKNFEEQWSGDYSIGKQSGLWWDKATGAGIIIFIIIIISSSSSSSIVLYETEIVQQEMGQDETIGSEAIASAYIWLLILMPRCRYMLRWTCNSIWREGGGPTGSERSTGCRCMAGTARTRSEKFIATVQEASGARGVMPSLALNAGHVRGWTGVNGEGPPQRGADIRKAGSLISYSVTL